MSKQKIFLLVLFGLVFLIYGQSLWGTFVFDDRGILDHWEMLSHLGNLKEVLSFPYWIVEAGLYRPITLLSYSFNIIFLGGSALSFHLVNLLIYFGICTTIYFLIKKLFENERLAVLSSLIFLVLPIHAEVVANITGRSELLALLFSLLALIEVVKGKSNFWLVGIFSFLAIGSKESAIAVLPLIFIVTFIIGKINFRTLSAGFVGVLAYFFLRFFVLGTDHFIGVETSLIENPLIYADTYSRVATALQILWMYVSKTFSAVNLCADYSYNQIPVLENFSGTAILGLLVMIGSIITFFVFIRRRPVISFASAIFLASFIPVSNIFFTTGTVAGERLFFFPSLGFALLLAYALSRINKKFVTIAIISLYAIFSFSRQSVWMSEERLFSNAAECAPESALSHSHAGAAYYLLGDYERARYELELSRSIEPIYSKGLNNLGLVYWKQGDIEEAKVMFYESLKQKYPYPGAIENLVLLYAGEKDYDSANRWLRLFNNPQ